MFSLRQIARRSIAAASSPIGGITTRVPRHSEGVPTRGFERRLAASSRNFQDAAFKTILATALILSSMLAGASPADNESKTNELAFDRDIRPILAENCYACHGPDEGKRKAKLRLDRKDEAFKALTNGDFAIVPGDPGKSKIIERITSKDEDEVMPPVKTGKKLTPQQIEQLRRWIASGAKWEIHWAFVPPVRPTLPAVTDTNWGKNEVDAFVLARLEGRGLHPSPEADRATLIRRVTLDLTGLPPTVEEVDAFLVDKSPDAYDKVVNRLLSSPHYGEQFARYWLDAVRYADSHGYHIDGPRDIWAYRDWVIGAFNQNLPYDQFTIEQLAGDLLPNATTSQKIASGYNRCNLTSNEGGAIEDEFLARSTFDRTETTATIWLGLTWTCARCHSHKYDPITQRDYYSLYAFFNSLDVPVFDQNVRNPEPFMKLPTPDQTERQGWLKKQITVGEARVEATGPEMEHSQAAWAEEWHHKLNTGWAVLEPLNARYESDKIPFKVADDHSVSVDPPASYVDCQEVTFKLGPGPLAALRLEILADAAPPAEGAIPTNNPGIKLAEWEAEIIPPGKNAPPQPLKFAQAVADASEHDHEADQALDGRMETEWRVGPEESAQAHQVIFRLEAPVIVPEDAQVRMRLRDAATNSRPITGHFRLSAARDATLVDSLTPSRLTPWQVLGPLKIENLDSGLATVYEPEKEIDFNKTYAGAFEDIKWENRTDFDDGKRHALVTEIYSQRGNGVFFLSRTVSVPTARRAELSLRADDLFKVWVNGRLVATRAAIEQPGDGPVKTGIDLHAGENQILVKVVNYENKLCFFTFNLDLENHEYLSADLATALAATANPSGSQAKPLRDYFRHHGSFEYSQMFAELEALKYENDVIERTVATTLISKEMEKPRPAFRLNRGEYDKPGESVDRAVPSFLPPLPKDASVDRLGLAQWLVDPGNPLTARVTVNRFWQQYFGVGLVKTTEDFGVQGERPSHPELLDWLATEFIRTGWDVKRFQRLIVTSATYRQTSRGTPEQRTSDPENRLLARGPRFRVDAEVVRDTMLAASGLLVDELGGPSVKPYQPPGLWEAVSHDNRARYVPATDQEQYRRSLYTCWKRQAPPPNLSLFDAPTRETCIVRRARTSTPLQALALLNDPQMVDGARAFARRILLEGGPTEESRLIFGFRLVAARPPEAPEVKVLERVLDRQLIRFRADGAAAEKLAQTSGSQPGPALDPAELAAWTTIASTILNLDEAITKN